MAEIKEVKAEEAEKSEEKEPAPSVIVEEVKEEPKEEKVSVVEEKKEEKEAEKKDKLIEVKPLEIKKEYKDVAINSEIPSPQKEVIIPLCLPPEEKPEPKAEMAEKLPIVEKSEWAEVIDFGVDEPVPEKPPVAVPRPVSQEKALVQHETMCSICRDDYGILGDRYQCIFCESFNLCSSCEQKIEHPHALLKVKDPKKAVSREQLVKIFGSQGPRVPEGVAPIPPTHYVPSINKEEAMGFLREAQKSLDDGYDRGRRMLEDMFVKLELNHRNPYEHAKPLKVETAEEKATNLSNLFGINYREALTFAKRFPNKTSEQVTQIYIDHENKKKEVKYPLNPYEGGRPHYRY